MSFFYWSSWVDQIDFHDVSTLPTSLIGFLCIFADIPNSYNGERRIVFLKPADIVCACSPSFLEYSNEVFSYLRIPRMKLRMSELHRKRLNAFWICFPSQTCSFTLEQYLLGWNIYNLFFPTISVRKIQRRNMTSYDWLRIFHCIHVYTFAAAYLTVETHVSKSHHKDTPFWDENIRSTSCRGRHLHSMRDRDASMGRLNLNVYSGVSQTLCGNDRNCGKSLHRNGIQQVQIQRTSSNRSKCFRLEA